ncbi:molybdopterin-synthase adenylyltransferase MoeB [Oleiphilus sp. HI0009]|nr:molybdopterin-synthase adenylyltransferase MoeB [Oleiphilus sp. HI0009]KZX77897.1 molybdopterin-synthase adenylyltransferase MoeB [Oleiphilus sp. HI0009]KZY70130.1 molybdopterin-synthase adenylyltransferase MoeB [Oleiphilus sp. HI0067]KZY71766.1 molybdopterin-synthase adenylyltransferase MoeB [Oleiphilus sp. HI0066]KZZ59322.1 molybdopterin-synthase adenylyltransferase MoeB [Oleiphilus sp. HI0125]
MNDEALLRYSRQLMLPGFDVAGQLALSNARILIIGAGGLGSPAALYLAAAGAGRLTIVDDDIVELSNLQRQIAHGESAIGQSKVVSAKDSLKALNKHCEVIALEQRFVESDWAEKLSEFDVVLDCSDNFETRFSVNRLCVKSKVPLVSGAAIRMEGQLAIYDSREDDSPCYRCLYDEQGNENLNCSTNGVMAPLVGVIGSMQALEAIKLVSGYGERSAGKLLIYDALSLDWRTLKLRKDPECPECA